MIDFLKNIFKAFRTSLRLIFSEKVTLGYPNECSLRSRKSRLMHELDAQNCAACRMCEKTCPAKAISIKSHFDKKQILDEYIVDYGKCCFCGNCVDACHKKNIFLKKVNSSFFSKDKSKCLVYRRRS